MSRTPRLTASDVDRLAADRSAQARIETMTKLVEELSTSRLEAKEVDLARELLERFARDAEIAVREAVAWQIHNSPLLTGDLARRLAGDVGQVAFPVLRYAEQLADDFLVEVIAGRDAEKQVAIAGRASVSAAVADAIVESANLSAIGTLLRNEGAAIAPPTLEKVADRYGEVPFVAEPLAARPALPLGVVEKLLHQVSEDLRRSLVQRYGLSPAVVRDLVARGREAATLLMIRPLARRGVDVELLARHLLLHGRLTPAILFRALCAGDLDLFFTGVAVRAGIGLDNARTLLLDDGALALRAVFEKARIPFPLLPPFRSALKVLRDLGYAGGEAGRRAFQITVLARVQEECAAIEDRAVDDLLLQLYDQKSDDMIDEAMALSGLPFTPLREAGM
ncbi:MAG: hypothetical protein RLY86_1995 [Pseudomonadota bacterium]